MFLFSLSIFHPAPFSTPKLYGDKCQSLALEAAIPVNVHVVLRSEAGMGSSGPIFVPSVPSICCSGQQSDSLIKKPTLGNTAGQVPRMLSSRTGFIAQDVHSKDCSHPV